MGGRTLSSTSVCRLSGSVIISRFRSRRGAIWSTLSVARWTAHAKRFKFIIGHDIGKLEICGRTEDKLILTQLYARPGYQGESSRILIRQLTDTGGWLDDLPEVGI